MTEYGGNSREDEYARTWQATKTLFQQKKLYHFSEPRAAAPVATTSLGLGICTCPRPKEVVDGTPMVPMVSDGALG